MIRHIRARRLALVLAVGASGVASAAVAQPAQAATCVTAGSVSVGASAGGDINRRFETEPLNSPYFARPGVFRIVDPEPLKYSVRLGGNGLKPGSRPTWDVYTGNDQFIGTLSGHQVGGNCVADEVTYSLLGYVGDVYKVKANYDAGNSGATIRSQNFFFVTYQKAL